MTQNLLDIKDSGNDMGYKYLLLNIKQEINDVDAIQDAINQKFEYETQKEKIQSKQRDYQLDLSKHLAGRMSIRTLFTNVSKEQLTKDIEKKIQQCSNDCDNVQFICDIVSVILGYIEIKKFK